MPSTFELTLEFSAASALAGASAAGVRAYTASSSQGLLLMTEVIYYLAGARLPVVITGVNRQVSAPVGLQPDHQDTVSLRDAGVIQLYVESPQEAYDTHLQAFKIAEDHQILLPVMVCVDGYTLTHVSEPVMTFDQASVDAFLPPYKPLYYLTPDNPMTFGAWSDETNNLEFRYMHHQAMLQSKARIEAVAQEYRAMFGQYHGALIDTYGTEDAEVIIVAMGSTVSTLRDGVDKLRSEGKKVGVVKIRSFRPFPTEALRGAVCHACAVVVLDRALSVGFQGVLASNVKAALYDIPQCPLVLGMLAGYGGREVAIDSVRKIVDRAWQALDDGLKGRHWSTIEGESGDVEFVGLKPEILKENAQQGAATNDL